MIRQYELIDKILKYNDKADVALINRAYVYSMKAHGNQKRASGGTLPYTSARGGFNFGRPTNG